MPRCQSCGVEAPTKHVEFHQNIVTPFMLINNVVRFVGTRGLEPPSRGQTPLD